MVVVTRWGGKSVGRWCWGTDGGVTCSLLRATWAGPEEGQAGPCSLASRPPQQLCHTVLWHRFWITTGLSDQVLAPEPLRVGVHWAPGGAGAALASQVFLGVVDRVNQKASQRKVGLVGGVATCEKPSRPPANGQELGHPPRSSTLNTRVLTGTEWPHRAGPRRLTSPVPACSPGPAVATR